MKKPSDVITAGQDDDGKRIDRVLQQAFPQLLRSNIFRALRKGLITINNKKSRPESRIKTGDSIQFYFPIPSTVEKETNNKNIINSDISKSILYQDDNIIAVNKPGGMLVHGPGSLEEHIVLFWEKTKTESLSFRPGPLHRLDRNTSGVLLFSLSVIGARLFTGFFHDHNIHKIYVGITDNKIESRQIWKDSLERNERTRKTGKSEKESGKFSITKVIPVTATQKHTLALFIPETGRTHQIRAQAYIHGFPLTGDTKYGGSATGKYYMLHALCIHLDSTEYKLPDIIAPLPEQAGKMIADIFGAKSIQNLDACLQNELSVSQRK